MLSRYKGHCNRSTCLRPRTLQVLPPTVSSFWGDYLHRFNIRKLLDSRKAISCPHTMRLKGGDADTARPAGTYARPLAATARSAAAGP
ncbi:hypothetical protein I79_016667 [Cricetulus griseus]|uniref:Uncharacterized protein n=1 Tax=Cricetulus griseus TaxID=10029 RepID=G3I002_CRIGR|nr:hypothetical protein I79_016667 [Cricetulus griseus]